MTAMAWTSSVASYPAHPAQGKRVRCTTTGRVGILYGQMVGETPEGAGVTRVFVRPLDGGVEWTARPDEVRPLDW